MEIQKILVPTDLSGVSAAALNTAKKFANSEGKVVDFLHVIPLSRYLGDSFDRLGIPLNMEKEVFPKIIENMREELKEFVDEFITVPSNRGELLITVDRRPSESIIKQSEKKKYDLIMMSSKGEHESELFHGSATEKVIRQSKVPVLILSDIMDLNDVKNIVVPCDFSKRSLSAIPYAFDIAQMLDARIEVLNIIELYSADIYGMEPTVMADINEDDVQSGLMNQLRQYFDKYDGEYKFSMIENDTSGSFSLVREKGTEKVSVDMKCVVHKSFAAHHDIVDYANENADMVVISTHGRTGLSRMLLGSTTEQVIQHLDKHQLTIKTAAKD